MIITLKGATASKNLGGLSFYSIIVNKSSGVIVTLDKTTVDKASASSTTVTGTLAVAEGYTLSSVKIMMGTTDKTSAWYNSSTGAITISSITANVVITANATSNSGSGDGGEDLPSTLTFTKTNPSNGVFIMEYQGAFAFQSNATSKTNRYQVLAVDVSGYEGRTLSITATQAVIAEAYYTIFTNELAGGHSIQDVANLSEANLSESANGGKKQTLDASIIVEKFTVSTKDKTTATIQKVVPSGAKYLYVTNLTQSQTSEPSVEVI